MLSKREQMLILEMSKKGSNKRFTRNELMEMGGYESESGLSRAITNLYYHFMIEENKVEYPKYVTREMLKENIPDEKEQIEFFRSLKEFAEKMGPDVEFHENPLYEPTPKKEIIDTRMKNKWEMRRKYRQTPKKNRITYSLPPEGEHFGRLLKKSGEWLFKIKGKRKI